MSSFKNELARFMLQGKVPSKAAAAKLIAAASLQSPTTLSVVPDDAAAVALTKSNSWATAASLAQSSTSPAFLQEMARSTSLQVRRLVAANPHTANEVVRGLHHWALRTKHDEELLELTIPRLEVEHLLEELVKARADGKFKVYPAHRLGASIVALSDPARIELILSTAPHDIVLAAAVAYQSDTCSLTPRRFIAASPEEIRDQVVRTVAHRITHVSLDEAELLCETGAIAKEQTRGRHHVWRTYAHDRYLSMVTTMDADAARLWLGTDNVEAHDTVAMCMPDESFVDPLLAKDNPQLAFTLLQLQLAHMRADQIERAIAQLSDPSTPEPPDTLFDAEIHELSSEARLVVLRRCGSVLTQRWVVGSTKQDPRPGEFNLLVENPGRGFVSRWARINADGSTVGAGPAPTEDVHALLYAQMETIVTKPWADEVVDACGWTFVNTMVRSYGDALAQYVTNRVVDTVGSDEEMFEQAFVMLSRTKTSLGRTLQTVMRMHAQESESAAEVIYPDGRLFEI